MNETDTALGRTGLAVATSRVPWRPLHPGEIDHEKLWLAVGLGACLLGGAWLALDLPLPECNFKRITGLPCPTCGSTRAVRALRDTDILSAMQWNPLVTLGFAAAAVYLLYAAVVLLFRLPRFRPGPPSARGSRMLRIAAVALLLVNWIYLFWAKV